MYDINPVQTTFDFENKYIMTVRDDIKYIKLRLKDVGEWSVILNKLLNINVVIIKDYETDKKAIHSTFTKFRSGYKIPRNLLELVKTCPQLNFYYSPTEIFAYLSTWERNSTDNVVYFSPVEYTLYQTLSSDNQHNLTIRRNHYMDMGCTCKACSITRCKTVDKILHGDLTFDRIIHDDSVVDLKTRIYKRVDVLNSRLLRQRRSSASGISGVFTSIVNR